MKCNVSTVVVGTDEAIEQVALLSKFVKDNWDALYIGATRLGCAIPEDYWAPERIQVGNTRLHFRIGVKYANGWKYSNLVGPSEADLLQTISDIQSLVKAAEKKLSCKVVVSLV